MGKKKKLTDAQIVARSSANIDESIARWRGIIFNNECADPTWSDGSNANLVRNHILYEKREIEDTLKDNFIAYPESYFIPTPPEVPMDFMCKDIPDDSRVMCDHRVSTFKRDLPIISKWGTYEYAVGD